MNTGEGAGGIMRAGIGGMGTGCTNGAIGLIVMAVTFTGPACPPRRAGRFIFRLRGCALPMLPSRQLPSAKARTATAMVRESRLAHGANDKWYASKWHIVRPRLRSAEMWTWL